MAGVLKACSMALRCAGGRVPACPVAGQALKGLRGITAPLNPASRCPEFNTGAMEYINNPGGGNINTYRHDKRKRLTETGPQNIL